MTMNSVSMMRDGKIAVITIDNPPQNVLSAAVVDGLLKCVEDAANDKNCRAVVLTGAGEKSFSAGADVKALWGMINGSVPRLQIPEIFSMLEGLSVPTIAALNGHALGGGLELALTCDLRIGSENILLGLPEVKLGLIPGGGGTQRLLRLIGKSFAKELLFSGEFIKADRAMQMGLINKIVPREKVLTESIEQARKLSGMAADAVRYIKAAVDRGAELPLEEGLELETEYFHKLLSTAEAMERIQNFLAAAGNDAKLRR